MVEQRLRYIEGQLRSIEDFRRRALDEGDERKASRAEQTIVQFEQQAAMLAIDLERPEAGRETEGRAGHDADAERMKMERAHVVAINGDPDFLNFVRGLLQDERYNVTTTNYVPRTFDLIAALGPSLLLVDLVMGERAGWDLLERLHAGAATRGIPVIALSPDQRLLDRAEADEARYGVQRFLLKPLDYHGLLEEIDGLIGRAERRTRTEAED